MGILKVSLLESTNIKRSGGTNNKNWEYTNRINREIGLLTNTGRCTVTTNSDDNGSNRNNDSNNSRTPVKTGRSRSSSVAGKAAAPDR